jgi:hypothetical protein
MMTVRRMSSWLVAAFLAARLFSFPAMANDSATATPEGLVNQIILLVIGFLLTT